MIARRAIIAGRVQGVGFRFFAERVAREFGVKGWVRNMPDGSVETVAEGEGSAVAKYLARLSEGPRLGKVISLNEEETVPKGFTSFEVVG